MKKFILAVVMAISTVAAFAQTYPSRPIQIIVPFAAGGGADNALRAVEPALERQLGHKINIINMPGIIGTVKGKNAVPDGYTLVLTSGSTHGANQVYVKSLPYDAEADFEYITVLGESTRGVFVKTNGSIKNYQDFLAQARDPKFNMVAGINSNDLMNAEFWKQAVKITTPVIPYPPNTPPYITDLLGGTIQAAWQNVPSMVACTSNNTCKPIAVTSNSRLPEFPDVPTFKELGFNNIRGPSYFGIAAPTGTPADIVTYLNRDFAKAMADSETLARFKTIGLVPVPVNVAEARHFHQQQIEISRAAGKLMNVIPQ
jgi:tripartite-type tricarboxylate transporter receptor subunit TctC